MNEEAFLELCNAMKYKLFTTAKGILGNDALALDAVSEAVFRAYKSIKKLKNPQFAETWFTRILINAAKDLYQRQLHETTVDVLPEQVYSDQYDNIERLEFNQLIESLPFELRNIISLKYYSEYTLSEISFILKIPKGTVKSRLNRALKILRMEVENEDE